MYYYILSTYSWRNCLEFSLENLYADIAWGVKGLNWFDCNQISVTSINLDITGSQSTLTLD